MKLNRKKVEKWVRANPALAAVVGAGALFFVVLLVVIISLVSGSGPSKRDLAAVESEQNICVRVGRLNEMQSGQKGQIDPGYLSALGKAYQELTHEDASTQDSLALAQASCAGLSNEDLAWRVQVQTRLKHGVWPAFPVLPPTAAQVQTDVREVTHLSSRLTPTIAADVATRSAWLRFAAEGGTEDSVVLAQFYRKDQRQTDELALYEELIRMGDKADWLTDIIASKLGLLPEPLHVVDRAQPDKTLPFLGVLEGERCAIAKTDGKHPSLTLRPCAGLVPRRLSQGELVLVGAAVPMDTENPAHWLPLLVDDRGDVFFGTKLTIDARVLGAFMAAAPRFQLGAKALVPFAPTPSVAQARNPEGETFPSFMTTAVGKPSLLAFSDKAQVSTNKKCAKIDLKRCEAVRGDDPTHKCAMEPSHCFILPSDTEIRATVATLQRPELCMKENGENAVCPAAITVGLFIDVRHADETAFDSGRFIELHTGRKEQKPSKD